MAEKRGRTERNPALFIGKEALDLQRVKARLESELAKLLGGLRLSSAAVLRGDGAKLQAVYGAATTVLTRGMQALVRMCRARKALAERRAEVEAEAQATREVAAKGRG